MNASPVRITMEYNKKGCLLYLNDFPGAFARGETEAVALAKIPGELSAYCRWRGISADADAPLQIEERVKSELNVQDADSEVLLAGEELPLSPEEYAPLRVAVLRSAQDFQSLYASVPNRDMTNLTARGTFYGALPRTPREMFTHTNNVTSYYAAQLGVLMNNLPNIAQNRLRAIQLLEGTSDYLKSAVVEGDYQEQWSFRKVLRRFLWHDRIHARALYRLGTSLWENQIPDVFKFNH